MVSITVPLRRKRMASTSRNARIIVSKSGRQITGTTTQPGKIESRSACRQSNLAAATSHPCYRNASIARNSAAHHWTLRGHSGRSMARAQRDDQRSIHRQEISPHYRHREGPATHGCDLHNRQVNHKNAGGFKTPNVRRSCPPLWPSLSIRVNRWN